MLRTLTLIIFSLFLTTAYGQERGYTEQYISFGAGGSLTTTRNEGLSPLRYSGALGLGDVSYYGSLRSDTIIHELKSLTGIGQIKSDVSGKKWLNLNSELSYTYLRLFKSRYTNTMPRRRVKYHLGGTFNANWNLINPQYFVNNAYNNNVAFSLAPTFTVMKPYVWLFDFRAKISIPVVSAIARPEYASTTYEGFREDTEKPVSQLFNSLEMASFGKYFNLNTSFEFKRSLNKYNDLIISYHWDYRTYKGENISKLGNQYLLLALRIYIHGQHTKEKSRKHRPDQTHAMPSFN